MKTQDIRSMGLAYLEVLEGKDAVNKHGHDHVGKEDDDVNNDKKVDSTDKYLLNRRKAISANIRKEETEEVDEALVGNQHKIDANKNGRVDSHDFKLLRKGKKVAEEKEEGAAHEKAEKKTVSAKSIKNALASAKAQAKPKSAVSLAKTPWNEEVESVDEVSNASKVFNKIAAKAGGGEKGKKMAAGLLNKMKKEEVELDEVSAVKLGQYSTQAARQGGSDKRVAGQKMADEKVRKKYGYSSSAKVAAGSLPKKEATEWPVFARIQEKSDKFTVKYNVSGVGDDPHEITMKFADPNHVKGATKAEPMDDKWSEGEKKFVDMHGGLKGTDSGIHGHNAAAHTSKAATAGVKQAPGRPGDQKIGDKTPPKASA